MSARSFRSVFMVASCAGAALGCYLVSLRVASERAALQDVETRIVMAQRDIRLLETEIGTRGRLAQLERWNVRVLALSAPSADQFLDGGFALARLIKPEPKIAIEAPVVLASAPAEAARPQLPGADQPSGAADDRSATADQLLHVASLPRVPREERQPEAKRKPEPVAVAASEPTVFKKSVEKKVGDKQLAAVARPVTKPVRVAKADKVDPLAPLPATTSKTSKDSGATR